MMASNLFTLIVECMDGKRVRPHYKGRLRHKTTVHGFLDLNKDSASDEKQDENEGAKEEAKEEE